MKMFRPGLCALGLAVVALAVPGVASAQATRTWVSGVGDDANPCSRTAPCKTFAGAISKTAAGGTINVLDPGGFGGVTITKSISIVSPSGWGGVLVSGTNAIVVNAGSSDVVRLKGIDISGLGTGINGINFIGGKSLHVQNVHIEGFTQAGINVSGDRKLTVVRSTMQKNLYGILAGGGKTSINDTSLEGNAIGLFVGAAKASIRNCDSSANTSYGFYAYSTLARLNIESCLVEGNQIGITSDTAIVRVSNTTVSDNALGLQSLNGGQLLSRANNTLQDNDADGAFTGFFGVS
jgi:parallel beta helix pectate lyase-like protein